MNIRNLIDPRHITREVEVYGMTLTMRMVTAAEAVFVRACLPDPLPPMKPDPNRGSLAPPVVDENDRGHRQALAENYMRRRAAMVAISLGLSTAKAGPPSALVGELAKAYVLDVASEMLTTFGENMLLKLSEELESIDLGQAVGGAAKN